MASTRPSCNQNEPLGMGDDAASLRAALAAIDDWDFDFGFLFQDADDQPRHECDATSWRRTGSTNSSTPKPAPYTGRNRRKLEIQSLRAQSLELEQRLERATREAEAAARASATPQGVEGMQIASAWEQLAATQRAQREAKERTNQAIRESLVTQAKIARQLFNTSHRVRVPPGLLPTASLDSIESFVWDGVSPADHLVELDALHARTTSVFDRACFHSNHREFQHIEVLGDTTTGPIVQSDIAMVLPFSVDQVADALWHYTVRMSSHERVYQFRDLDKTPSSLVSLFSSISNEASFERGMQGQIASRRYAVAKDDVREIVSAVHANVVLDSDTTLDFHGDGWMRITPIHRGVARSSTDGATSPLTQVHWHRRIHVTSAHEALSRSIDVQLLPDAMVERVRETVAWNLQSVENRLLAQRLVLQLGKK